MSLTVLFVFYSLSGTSSTFLKSPFAYLVSIALQHTGKNTFSRLLLFFLTFPWPLSNFQVGGHHVHVSNSHVQHFLLFTFQNFLAEGWHFWTTVSNIHLCTLTRHRMQRGIAASTYKCCFNKSQKCPQHANINNPTAKAVLSTQTEKHSQCGVFLPMTRHITHIICVWQCTQPMPI